jgi:hypothetical protein
VGGGKNFISASAVTAAGCADLRREEIYFFAAPRKPNGGELTLEFPAAG